MMIRSARVGGIRLKDISAIDAAGAAGSLPHLFLDRQQTALALLAVTSVASQINNREAVYAPGLS